MHRELFFYVSGNIYSIFGLVGCFQGAKDGWCSCGNGGRVVVSIVAACMLAMFRDQGSGILFCVFISLPNAFQSGKDTQQHYGTGNDVLKLFASAFCGRLIGIQSRVYWFVV